MRYPSNLISCNQLSLSGDLSLSEARQGATNAGRARCGAAASASSITLSVLRSGLIAAARARLRGAIVFFEACAVLLEFVLLVRHSLLGPFAISSIMRPVTAERGSSSRISSSRDER